MKISINPVTNAQELTITGTVIFIGTDVHKSKENKKPYRWVKTEVMYPSGEIVIYESVLWETLRNKFPDVFIPGENVQVRVQIEDGEPGFSTLELPSAQLIDVSQFTFQDDDDVESIDEDSFYDSNENSYLDSKISTEEIKYLPGLKTSKYLECSDDIPEMTPDEIIVDYTNIWGEQVSIIQKQKYVNHENPNKEINLINFGEHSFGDGYYNINEKGEEVFAFEDNNEFLRIGNKVRLTNILKDHFKEKFEKFGYPIRTGPNNSVAIDDIRIVHNCYWDISDEEGGLEKTMKIMEDKIWKCIIKNKNEFDSILKLNL